MPTIECEACRTSNTLDSRFCRQCGLPLPEAAVDAAHTEILALVGDGRRLLADGRVAEALMIAESALEFDYDMVEGLALYGDCRERQERFSEAAESYERILELRPDSPLDRIRLGHLRKLAQQQEIQVAEPRQKRQLLYLSGAVAVVLVSVGFALTLSNSSRPDPSRGDIVASNTDPGLSAFDIVPPVPEAAGPDARKAQADDGEKHDGDVPMANFNRVENAVESPFSGGSRVLPRLDIKPLSVDPSRLASQTGTTSQSNSNPAGAAASQDNSVASGDSGGDAGNPPKKEEDPGVVEISPSKTAVASQSSPIAVENLIRVARDLYIQSKYDRAADAYVKALKLGASKGSTNQRLAQCYEKLNKNDDAVAAYKEAIKGLEADLKKKPDARADRALAACKKALSILGG